MKADWLLVLLGATLVLGTVSCSAVPGMPVSADGVDAAVFQDPDSDFSTSDVRDIDGEIVRFDAVNAQLIWVADSLAFDGFDVNGNTIRNGFFMVRFGTENGQRRAYFTETDPPTICDISAPNGALSISSTEVTVPQE